MNIQIRTSSTSLSEKNRQIVQALGDMPAMAAA